MWPRSKPFDHIHSITRARTFGVMLDFLLFDTIHAINTYDAIQAEE